MTPPPTPDDRARPAPEASTRPLGREPLQEDCPEGMVLVPGGKFLFGSPDQKLQNPLREIAGLPFCIAKTEVTVAAYQECAAAGRCPAAPVTPFSGDLTAPPGPFDDQCNAAHGDRQGHPINCVNLTMAEAFCWSSGARLPTEIEWEHAARGGDGRDYPWGSASPGPNLLDACDADCRAFVTKLGGKTEVLFRESDGFATTAPVGRFPAGASPYGVLDMAGNVAEWTSSAFCKGATDTCRTKLRVLRGGSWSASRDDLFRTSSREPKDPSVRTPSTGFRCARTPGA